MRVKIPDLLIAAARAWLKVTHNKICPHGHATRGNIVFLLEVKGA